MGARQINGLIDTELYKRGVVNHDIASAVSLIHTALHMGAIDLKAAAIDVAPLWQRIAKLRTDMMKGEDSDSISMTGGRSFRSSVVSKAVDYIMNKRFRQKAEAQRRICAYYDDKRSPKPSIQ